MRTNILIFLGTFLTILIFSFSALAKPTVLTSFSIIESITQDLAGDLAQVETIVPFGQDPHHFEPTAKDIQKMMKADLIVLNGLGFEHDLEHLLKSKNILTKTLVATTGMQKIFIEKQVADPHAWLSVENAMIYAENISRVLIKLIPNGEKQILENQKIFLSKINLIKKQRDDFKIKNQTNVLSILCTHDSLGYFSQDLGFKVVPAENYKLDQSHDAKTFANISKSLKEKQIKAAFIESSVRSATFDRLVKESQIQLGGTLYTESLSAKDGPANTYIKLLEHNYTQLTQILSK